jgi:hypothetical protein
VAHQMAEHHMPTADRVAIVVVGKASDIKPALEEQLGPVRVVSREECEGLRP